MIHDKTSNKWKTWLAYQKRNKAYDKFRPLVLYRILARYFSQYIKIAPNGPRKDIANGFISLYKEAKIEVIPGVLREKSLDLFCKFFNKETNLYWKNSFLEAYTLDQKKDRRLRNK